MTEFYETTVDLAGKHRADLEAILFGEEDCAPGHSYGPTLRSYHLFHFITRGRGRVEVDGARFDLGPGDAFLIPAEQVSYYEADRAEPWSYVWAGFTGVRAAGYVDRILSASPERYVLRGLDTERYDRLIRPAAHLEGASEAHYFRCCAALYGILAQLFGEKPALRGSADARSVASRLRFFLDAKYTEDLRLADVARQFHTHPNHLSRAFRETYGVSPKQYLTRLKLDRAARLLRETDMPVSLIAALIGFEDQHAFSRRFRKDTGRSPTEYREEADSDAWETRRRQS